jgi:hypothetical protein
MHHACGALHCVAQYAGMHYFIAHLAVRRLTLMHDSLWFDVLTNEFDR